MEEEGPDPALSCTITCLFRASTVRQGKGTKTVLDMYSVIPHCGPGCNTLNYPSFSILLAVKKCMYACALDDKMGIPEARWLTPVIPAL